METEKLKYETPTLEQYSYFGYVVAGQSGDGEDEILDPDAP